MATALKDLYNKQFFDNFAQVAGVVLPHFDNKEFQNSLFDEQWNECELKDRMKHSAVIFRSYLKPNYKEATIELMAICDKLLEKSESGISVEYMFLPSIIEFFGVDDFENSIIAMTEVTKLVTCEFAVRPFYLKYPDLMLKQAEKWTKHPDFRVRRLASEGCRPMLPWAVALPAFKKDPSEIIKILELLKDDSEEFVRRSVANNLNDISKHHSELVVSIAESWLGHSSEKDKMVKHALRTLLKQGRSDVLEMFGYAKASTLKLNQLSIKTKSIAIGDRLCFEFEYENLSSETSFVRLEYAIYFLLANGQHSKKVFKITEKPFEPNRVATVLREHSFKIISTRKYYKGTHQLSLILNGKEYEKKPFQLA